MKKILIIVTMIIFGILSCGNKNSADKGAKKLVVGTDGVFPPFGYIEKGELVGFDIDLIKQIGKDLGYEIEKVDIDDVDFLVFDGTIREKLGHLFI